MVKKGGKKVLNFYNHSGSLDNVIGFLESIQKKVNYINLNCTVEGKSIKISIFGSRDLQYLAIEKLRELADQFLS
ncbi:MAG: hypothetical protein ACTSRH_15315 [Promethearchaeota archaeon]